MHYIILGPSGAGKSHIAEELAKHLNGLWLEADLWPPRDGIDALDLRNEWNAFYSNNNGTLLCKEFDERAKIASKTCVVLSLPGFPILNLSHLPALNGEVRIAYITGTPGQCLDSFLIREQKTGRNLDIGHWANNTKNFFPALKREDISPLVFSNFTESGYRNLSDVIEELKTLS